MFKFLIIMSLSLYNQSPDIPELNKKIISYVDNVIGTKVDRGECWDLAAGALEYSGSYFDRSSMKTITTYGRKVDPKKEAVLSGDLIQFENVKMEWKDGATIYSSIMEKHTAIVYKVNADMDYEIAHQNTGEWGKKVGISNLSLAKIKKGKVMIYRPIKGKS